MARDFIHPPLILEYAHGFFLARRRSPWSIMSGRMDSMAEAVEARETFLEECTRRRENMAKRDRPCLTCGEAFLSRGNGNRMCGKCRRKG